MGLGVATMHYTGMAAMQMAATISYDPTLFVLSILIAIAAATVALWLTFNLDQAWQKVAAGFAMGGAIAGMHYTAMAAAIYTPAPMPEHIDLGAGAIPLLAAVIAVATFGVLLLGLLSSTADRKLSAQAEREAHALRLSERRFRTVLDTAHDAFIAIDGDGRIVSWNAEAERTFGWSSDEARGLHLADTIVPERFRDAHMRGLQRYVQTREPRITDRRLELTARHRSGREFPVELTISPMWVDGQLTVNAFIHDITSRKRAERDLIAAKEQAESADRAKSAFLANMSHELRTPLNAIIGFSDLMGEGLHGSLGHPAYAQYAADINRAGRHLLDLINDILDVSRADAGRLDLREEAIKIVEAVEMSVSTVRDAARRGGVDLAVTLADDLPDLVADARRVRQILINVLSNAVRFTPSGGRVTLRAALANNGDMAFTITDTGIGMTAQQIETALSAFGQVDSRLSRKHDGTGLGLPLTKRLLTLHQGSLDIVSTPGTGTVVTVRFPAIRVRPRSAAAE
jgi:PAS domain S-box-containing protein